MHQSERDITRAIRDVLRAAQVWHWKVHQGLGSTPGVSDIIGIHEGRLLAIEVKTSTGRLSGHQQAFIDRVNKEGGIGFVARSPDDVIRELGLGYRIAPMFNPPKNAQKGAVVKRSGGKA